jgi:hypothetical protein
MPPCPCLFVPYIAVSDVQVLQSWDLRTYMYTLGGFNFILLGNFKGLKQRIIAIKKTISFFFFATCLKMYHFLNICIQNLQTVLL